MRHASIPCKSARLLGSNGIHSWNCSKLVGLSKTDHGKEPAVLWLWPFFSWLISSRGPRFESHFAMKCMPQQHLFFTYLTYLSLSPRLPKAVGTEDNYLTESELQEEIIQPERTLQKVPNSSSPISRNQLWSGTTPGFYSDSPHETWPQEDYSTMSVTDDRLSIQVIASLVLSILSC